MAQITNGELWELFAGYDKDFDDPYRCFRNNDEDPIDNRHKVTWNDLDGIRNIVANAPQNLSLCSDCNLDELLRYHRDCTRYLLCLQWIRESNSLFGMLPLQKDDLLDFFKTAFILSNVEIINQDLHTAFDDLLKDRYVLPKDEDRWQPGMESGSGWVTIYPITLTGKKIAERQCKILAKQSPPSPPLAVNSVGADSPAIHTAATGIGNPPTRPLEIHGETAYIDPTDTSLDTQLTDIAPKAKNELTDVILEAEILKDHIPDVKKWDLISNRLYNGKGWAQITDKYFPGIKGQLRECKIKAIEKAVKEYRQKKNDGQK